MYRKWQGHEDRLWYWDLRAMNHKVILRCHKPHKTLAAVSDEIRQVWNWAKQTAKPMDSIGFHQTSAAGGYRHYFTLTGLTGKNIIACSNTYKTPRNMNGGLNVVSICAESKDTFHIRDPNMEVFYCD